MPKRKAARKKSSEIEPSLLHTLPRPTDPEQLSIWTAKVRERLAVIQGVICTLESEKQVLLSLLSDASDASNDGEVLDAPRSEICRGEVPTGESSTLWNAAQGFPSDVLANDINESSVHPALRYDVKIVKSFTEFTDSNSDIPDIGSGNGTSYMESSEALKSVKAVFGVANASTASEINEACEAEANATATASEPVSHTHRLEALSNDIDMVNDHPHHVNPELLDGEGAGNFDVNPQFPRSPSITSTILLSSEDEAQPQGLATKKQIPWPSNAIHPSIIVLIAVLMRIPNRVMMIHESCTIIFVCICLITLFSHIVCIRSPK